jgi:hypothetical protein
MDAAPLPLFHLLHSLPKGSDELSPTGQTGPYGSLFADIHAGLADLCAPRVTGLLHCMGASCDAVVDCIALAYISA